MSAEGPNIWTVADLNKRRDEYWRTGRGKEIADSDKRDLDELLQAWADGALEIIKRHYPGAK